MIQKAKTGPFLCAKSHTGGRFIENVDNRDTGDDHSTSGGKAGYDALRETFYDASPFYNVYNNSREIKVARKGTRAEIIPYFEAFRVALDYYNEVN